MVERLCNMAEDAGCRMPIAPQRDEGRVEGQHEAVVGADTALQGVGDGLEDDQFLEAVGLMVTSAISRAMAAPELMAMRRQRQRGRGSR